MGLQTTATLNVAATTLTFDQPSYHAEIPRTGRAEIDIGATAYDPFGQPIPNTAITYSIIGPNYGVSINATTGLTSIPSGIQPNTISVRALYNGILTTTALNLTVPQSLRFGQTSYSAGIPDSGISTIAAPATAFDNMGQPIPNANIAYSITGSNHGVGIDATTGVVTIPAGAQPGTVTLTAAFNGSQATARLDLTAPPALRFSQASYDAQIRSFTTGINMPAIAYDTLGRPIQNAIIQYSVLTPNHGVSVLAQVGSVSIPSNAQPGTVTLMAVYNGLQATAELNLTLPPALRFEQSSFHVRIPEVGTSVVTYAASAFDTMGHPIPNAGISYSIVGSGNGASVNPSTGAVTIPAGTQPGDIMLRAEYNGIQATVVLNLRLPITVRFSQPVYAAEIPTSGTVSITVSATVFDNMGQPIPITASYNIVGSNHGVSMSISGGIVTIPAGAQPGTVTLMAYIMDFWVTAPLNLTVPQSLVFNQSAYAAEIPLSGTATVMAAATAFDTLAQPIQNANISFSILNPNHGVSINASTGMVSIPSGAQPGTVTLRAAHNGLEATVTLTLSLKPTISFDESGYTIEIISGGTASIIVSATAFGTTGQPIHGAQITYSIVGTHTGVSIFHTSGLVNILHTAQAGIVTVTASYNGQTVEAHLEIIAAPLQNLLIAASHGREYHVNINAENIASFAGRAIVVTYNHTQMQLLNVAEQVYGTYTSVGAIPGTGITVTQAWPGTLTLVFSPSIPQGSLWSGTVTILKFKALTTGNVVVNVSM